MTNRKLNSFQLDRSHSHWRNIVSSLASHTQLESVTDDQLIDTAQAITNGELSLPKTNQVAFSDLVATLSVTSINLMVNK